MNTLVVYYSDRPHKELWAAENKSIIPLYNVIYAHSDTAGGITIEVIPS